MVVSTELLTIQELEKKVDKLIEMFKKFTEGSQTKERKWYKTTEFLKHYGIGRTKLARLIKEKQIEVRDMGCGFKYYRFVKDLEVAND